MRSLLFIALLMVAGGESVLAQNWAAFGPVEASVNVLAVDPVNTNVLYAGANTGLFKSTDGGANWRRVSGFEGLWVTSIRIDARNSNNIYAATYGRLFKSQLI